MKIKVLAIIALVCCLPSIYAVGANEENYRILQNDGGKTVIKVLGDFDIVVADIAPNGFENIYGDSIYGGQNFQDKQVIPNKGKPGIQILKDKNRVHLKVDYSDLSEKDTIKLFLANYTSNDWFCSDIPFEIILIKGVIGGASEDDEDDEEMDSSKEGQSYPMTDEDWARHEDDGHKMNKKNSDKNSYIFGLFLIVFLIVLLVVLLIGCFLYIQSRKLEKLSQKCQRLREAVKNLENTNNNQIVARQTTLQNNLGKSSMSDDDIKKFIVEQVKQFIPTPVQPPITINSDNGFVTGSAKNMEKTTDTDNVKYHQDDNSFSLEQTDIKIFKIYSKKGEYYYTIVDDSAVREELIGMLQMFKGCITYQTTDGVAKRVEPVTEGKLRKDGNKFYVDANNKLVVRFV